MSFWDLVEIGYDGDAGGYGPEPCPVEGACDCTNLLADWILVRAWDAVIACEPLSDPLPGAYRDNWGRTMIRIGSGSLFGTDRDCFACEGEGHIGGEDCLRCEGYGTIDSPGLSYAVYRPLATWARGVKFKARKRVGLYQTAWIGDRL